MIAAPQPPDLRASEKENGKADNAETATETLGTESGPSARPLFARAYPAHPELRGLVDAFQRGDYARVRTESLGLATRVSDPEVARAARDLRSRLDPDPMALYLIGLTLALLLFLTAWFLWHAHA